MTKKEIKIVRKAILSHGDDFWTDKEEGCESNDALFYDILECLKEEGLDLKLVKHAG